MASGGGGRRRKPRRGSRAKGKKTKYLSLSDLIKAEVETLPASPWEEAEVKQEDGGDEGDHHQQQQMEAFTLFAAAPSLTDILGASAISGGDSPSASPDGSRGTGFTGEEEEDLARRALRGRERWVYCCSSNSSPTTTATTASSSPCSSAASTVASARSLLLKLDYEEILAAWANRGSLYIGCGADGQATPPEPEPELDNVFVDVGPSDRAAAAAACTWSSLETAGSGRAERVRRYKEKRLNRLFVKRIRYEVRQVNAVKRPRFKGRFIKQNEECELQPT